MITKLTNAWNEGSKTKIDRTLQSFAMMTLFAGLILGGIGIAAAFDQSNALDMYKSILGNHAWQIGLVATGSLLAAYLFMRIMRGPTSGADNNNGALQAAYVMLIAVTLFGCGLGIAAYASQVDYSKYALAMLSNHTFALLTASGGSLLLGSLIYHARNYKKPKDETLFAEFKPQGDI